ncbi:MAG: prolyl oligopeptidase family serine peptidase [Bacteroidales bacterium]|nr:prolyl oligopeptidase family serine peptidase [Candidatus Cryptobacteroides aphodequi]
MKKNLLALIAISLLASIPVFAMGRGGVDGMPAVPANRGSVPQAPGTSAACGSLPQAPEVSAACGSVPQASAVQAAAGPGACLASAEMLVVPSQWLGCNDTVYVFSPSGRETEKALPSLLLLHGWSGCSRDWAEHTDIQALAGKTGWRIICPDGFFDSWYIDKAGQLPEDGLESTSPAPGSLSTGANGMQWRKFFWQDLWPLLDEKYSLQPDRTFITGLSMGGHGAMNIFLDHPERFRGAGSMSGVLDLKYSGGSADRIPQMLGAENINEAVCREQCAVERLGRVGEICGKAGSAEKILVITCGYEDVRFAQAAREFDARCTELGLNHILMLSRAKHRWGYWTWVLPYHMDWFAQTLAGGSLGSE